MDKSHFNIFISFVFVTVLAACGEPQSRGADRVFVNGAVYTADEARSWVEAVAISGGEIVFVGSDVAAEAFIGTNTDVVDLDGKMLMPGFHDAHSHVRYGGTAAWGCDLQSEQDVSKIRSLLAECASSREYGSDEWVLGGNAGRDIRPTPGVFQ